jgi:predicted type IV restriction endonuclease
MDFRDQIKVLGERVAKLKDQILTEEATKNAFVMPFLQALGYDIFNPEEVVPEFVADLGIKKGEKIDYAVLKDGLPILLIECKWCNADLTAHDSQLFRYFSTTKTRFAILTNGVHYKFYTDLVKANIIDEKPFLEFTITDIKEAVVEELKKFHKSYFDVEQILSAASELKYSNEIRAIMANELANPGAPFIKFFVNQIYPRKATEKIVKQFEGIVKRSLNQLISDKINDLLKKAASDDTTKAPVKTVPEATANTQQPGAASDSETMADVEKEAFFVVKSILRNHISPSRIFYRPYQSYFSVMLDDTQRKQLCRLWLREEKKFIGLFEQGDKGRKETRYEITTIDDIYDHSPAMVETLRQYEEGIPMQTAVKGQEMSSGVLNGKPWSKDELLTYLNDCKPYQKLLLAALARSDGQATTGTAVLAQMSEIAMGMPSLGVTKILTGRDIAGARSGLKMRRKPLQKEDIIESSWSKPQNDYTYRIRDDYFTTVKSWVEENILR